MRRFLAVSMVMAGLTSGASGAVIPVQSKGGDISVTVAYTGKGPVDDTHEIWVYLFDSPAIGKGALPVVTQAITKSGAATVFKAVAQDPVYVAVAYDEKGDYDGTAGPPPTGTPIGIYSTDGKGTAVAVKTTGGATIKMSFSDTIRMQ